MSTNSIDPFDEFEFKPLTDGLGFHKKSVSLKDGLKSSGVIEDELQGIPTSMPRNMLEDIPKAPIKKHTFDDVLSALEKTPLARKTSAPADLQFTEPLPRQAKGNASNKKDPLAKDAMDIDLGVPERPVQSPFPQPQAYKQPMPIKPGTPAIIKQSPSQTQLNSVGTRRGAADSPQRKLMAATLSVPSAILDFIICSGLGLVFLAASLTVTKVDLNVVLGNLNRDIMTQIALLVMFVAVMQMYVVIARAIFGRTLGEWTFDLQIGQDAEQQLGSYPLKVAFRSFLNIITGLILLPLVSAIIGRDIAGQLSGVKLYRQRI
jgi:hypothetical protein